MGTIARVLAIGCLLSGCSVIDALSGNDDADDAGDDDDDDDGIQCPISTCYFSPSSYDPGFQPELVAVGSFDTNGGLDLAVAGASGELSYYFHDGTLDPGDFRDPTTSGDTFAASPQAIVAADFDNNGFDEVAGAADGIEVYAETNDIPFGGGSPGVALLAAGNFNNTADNFEDIAYADPAQPCVEVLFGQDADAFDSRVTVIDTTVLVQGLAAGDFDNDGDLDIAVATAKPDSNIQVFENDGNGGFTPQTPFEPCLSTCPPSGLENLVGLVAGDFDGDLKDDLAVLADCESDCPDLYNRIRVLKSNGIDNFVTMKVFELENPVRVIATGNLDDDPTMDLAWQDGLAPSTLSLANQPAFMAGGQVGTIAGFPAASSDLELVDLNNDDKADIIQAAPDLIDIMLSTESQ